MKLQDIKNVCYKCKARCCKMGGPEFTEYNMKQAIKIKPKYKNLFVKVKRDHYELKVKGGMCFFLNKDYSCSIHKARPLMCRCWPVFVDYKNSKKRYVIVNCPLTPYLTKKQLKIMKEQASKLPKEFIDCFETSLPKKELNLIMRRYGKFKKKSLKWGSKNYIKK